MLRVALLLAAIAANQASNSHETRGRVVNISGEAMSGVTIVNMLTGEQVKSNQNGEFVLLKAGDFVRFSDPGYRPVTKSAKDLLLDSQVTLKRDAQALWAPPTCSTVQIAQPMTGEWMQFALPPRVRLRHGHDVDYQTNFVCLGKACLGHGFGPLWSSGFPPRGVLVGLSDLQERNVQYRPDVGLQGVEYRATHSDGTSMRWVGVFGETISYEHAPKAAAELFDKIIDSLCWREKR